MKPKNYFIFVAIIFFSGCFAPSQETLMFQRNKSLAKNDFFVEVFAFNSNPDNISNKRDSLIIRISFPFVYLIFLNEDNFWKANYSCEFVFYDKMKQKLLQRFFYKDSIQTYERNKFESEFFSTHFFKEKNFKDDTIFLEVKLRDLNSAREYFASQFFNLKEHNLLILKNLSLNSYQIVSFGSYCFFEETPNDALYFSDNLDSTLTLTIEQFNRYMDTIKPKIIFNLNFSQDLNDLKYKFFNDSKLSQFFLKKYAYYFYDINKRLYEDTIAVFYFNFKNFIDTFFSKVIWFNKPKTLNNLNLIKKSATYILSDKEIQEFYRVIRTDKSNLALYNFWQKKFPYNRSFNKHMAEFYKRCDLAIEKFSKPGSFDGIEKDMGKIFILYGEPDKKERFLIEKNKSIEIWSYEFLNLKFKFIDYSGTGEYKLEK